jgi:hypothetical protein
MAEKSATTPVADERSSWRRRVARVVFVGGFIAAALVLHGRVPADQELVFRLEDDAASVREIEATWTPEGEREASGGVELRFDDRAPRSVRHRVSLPNGRYEVAVEVVRQTGDAALSHTTTTRRVNLEGGETVIPLQAR